MRDCDRISAGLTFLFVPGDRPERFEKAAASGADVVILDLEDAVAVGSKEEARRHIAAFLSGHSGIVVRVNGSGTPWHGQDLRMARDGSAAVMLPKSVPSDVIHATDVLGDAPIMALVETAAGVIQAGETARLSGVKRLAFGTLDLAAELGVSPDDRDAMSHARGALVMASAAAGIAGPVDGVTGNVNDQHALSDDVAFAKRLGFTGKLCIHPSQVRPAAVALMPTDDETTWAVELLNVSGGSGGSDAGVRVVDGRMIDKPVIDRARRILAVRSGGHSHPYGT